MLIFSHEILTRGGGGLLAFFLGGSRFWLVDASKTKYI